MPKTTRATVYLDTRLHRALRVKAAETAQSVSELVNAAVQRSLSEDGADLAVFRDRAREPVVTFESILKDLRRRGKL
jgi:hypothetical protein